MRNGPKRSDSIQVASSHLITTCATLAAIILFVVLGVRVVPSSFGSAVPPSGSLIAAFLLNIAIILFGWRRAKELAQAMAALAHAEQEAHRNAYVDCVTGLANRRALAKALAEKLRTSPVNGAITLIDLDHFKKVNDLHGHSAGDDLLNHVGKLLDDIAPKDSVVARLGGDEFALLMPVADAKDAEERVGAILQSLSAPIDVGAFHAHLSASAGLAMLVEGQSAEDMLRRADIAMYSAKRAGRNTLRWFDSDQEAEIKERAILEDEIRQGIDGDEFLPFFQPLINLETGETSGFEVLARWRSPRRGLVEPVDFIAICEASGMIAALSMNVMRKALIEAKDWPAHLKIAVNISPVQFRDPQLAERILKLLTETGFPARRLELEITEGSLIEHPEQAITVVQSLKNNGISIALDDFGTGYASLTQLQALPFDRIKIDKSFVATIGESEQSAAIVRTIASLGKLLCVPITAEGVESETIRQQLADAGCQDAQGWLFGRAVSAQFVRDHFDLPAEGSEGPLDPLDTIDHERRDGDRRAAARARLAAGRKW
ncbi:putative bifunctional diguanylate cyclase/phosphodiesterase [Sphingomonas alba]|uniref:EAL domain-containing protein n=1 Tax=Sphingomonas alba TaxID=2908208 RepID=A0ABT0RLZ2_9SPHN|nr:EAL domain-containing protein [Sphingomonas alba]MCL6683664.1 EAL domain-containing protein [Sphingomonas alba]